MKTINKLILLLGLPILTGGLATWFSPFARADEVISPFQTTTKQKIMSLTLEATIKKNILDSDPWQNAERKTKIFRTSQVTEWEKILKKLKKGNNREARYAAEKASILALSMVVISYNSPPPPQTVISATSATKTQTWKWQASCWFGTVFTQFTTASRGYHRERRTRTNNAVIGTDRVECNGCNLLAAITSPPTQLVKKKGRVVPIRSRSLFYLYLGCGLKG